MTADELLRKHAARLEADLQLRIDVEAAGRVEDATADLDSRELRLSFLRQPSGHVLHLRLATGAARLNSTCDSLWSIPVSAGACGQPYIRTWQMEPLAPATLAGLTPRDDDTEIRFYDDRTESIPFDEPTDLVAMSVETYTAKRSYQIASEFRRRGVPVVMGGFHPTLVPGGSQRLCGIDCSG